MSRPGMSGCIDLYGHAASTGSWLVCGWAPGFAVPQLFGEHRIRLRFEQGEIDDLGFVAGTIRSDLGDRGYGVILHLPASNQPQGRLLAVEVGIGREAVVMQATTGAARLDEAPLIEALSMQSLQPIAWLADRMRAILRRSAFDGSDTLDRFDGRLAFRIDEAVRCGSSGLLLNGWLMAPEPLQAIRLRCGRLSTQLLLRDGIKVARPDVVAKYGEALRSFSSGCGFVLHVPLCLEPGAIPYIEFEVSGGDVAYVRLLPSGLRGLDSIRNMLSNMTPRYDEVQRAFDTIGPALSMLNRERLATAGPHREIRFGTPPDRPACSVIVPVHGRIDYMEVQVALLAGHTGPDGFARRHELIYVIDDPEGAGAATYLADTLFRRFGLPLRLLLLEENLGFAPACNVGLGAAQGLNVCFLNSDVFPRQPDWLDRLLEDLHRHPAIGIVGPRLLFEDGTIQHQGMRYEPAPEFADWLFPIHPGRGSRPGADSGPDADPDAGLTLHPSITGACMVMSRQLARSLDGFDEDYLLGDFEDSDLCLRASARGRVSAIDQRVVLTHLERRSQAAANQTWRMNITLYNAWLHQRRWARRLAEEDASNARLERASPAAPPLQLEPVCAGATDPGRRADLPEMFRLSKALQPAAAAKPDGVEASAATRPGMRSLRAVGG